MPTTITKSIGTSSRDYSTVQAWEDAIPADLTSTDEIWVGECYNDSELTSTSTITFSGTTTDATRYRRLKCAAGQSFRDNASVQTNALKYNASNGVGIRKTSSYSEAIRLSSGILYVEGVQIRHGNGTTIGAADPSTLYVDYCILEATDTFGNNNSVCSFASGRIRNTLVHDLTTGTSAARGIAFRNGNTCSAYNCSIVAHSSPGKGVTVSYETGCIIKNCAIFGWNTPTDGSTYSSSGGSNATDNASGLPGSTGNLHSKTYTSQFEGTTSGAADYRAKSGGDLIDAGATDSTNGATDIAGTSRPSGSAYDIGCWELVQSSATSLVPQLRRSMRRLITRR